MSDSQNSLREFYKTDVIPMSASLSKNLKELKELIEEKNELVKDELEKSSSDSKDIQANLLKQIKILENDFKRSQAQSVESSNSVRRQKSKATKSKDRVLKNKHDRRPSNMNGYLKEGRKTKPKRQNWTRNGKAWKDKVKTKPKCQKV
ncbi:hypothetical protein Tco_0273001 [Tanacetum coccineum]